MSAAESLLIPTRQHGRAQPGIEGSPSSGPDGQVFENQQQEKLLTDLSKGRPEEQLPPSGYPHVHGHGGQKLQGGPWKPSYPFRMVQWMLFLGWRNEPGVHSRTCFPVYLHPVSVSSSVNFCACWESSSPTCEQSRLLPTRISQLRKGFSSPVPALLCITENYISQAPLFPGFWMQWDALAEDGAWEVFLPLSASISWQRPCLFSDSSPLHAPHHGYSSPRQ